MDGKPYDVAIIGGGIVGLATAMSLTKQSGVRVVVLEAEERLAVHQTGNNSGVIHSGLYYKPGSLKAKNCVAGRHQLYRFCTEHGIAFERCGKVVVAARESELPVLAELESRGRRNGLQGIRRLRAEELREYEPHVTGLAGLLVPETGIVDFVQVAQTYARIIQMNGGEIQTGAKFFRLKQEPDCLVLQTTRGDVRSRFLINCGGLQSDRIARRCGVDPGVHIVPFRGEYYRLRPERNHLVNNLIYPVPDPRFPFLGVHFTRMIHNGVEAGPNAVLAFKREGYRKFSFSLPDLLATFSYRGFWIMAARYWRAGFGEFYRSFSKGAFVQALQHLIPEISRDDLLPGGAGVRAQAVTPEGALLDDFHLIETERMVHVLNAPSPAATASLSIGKTVAAIATHNFLT